MQKNMGRARQATDGDKMAAQSRCDLHAGKVRQEIGHTLRICNTYRFYMATMVTRAHFIVVL